MEQGLRIAAKPLVHPSGWGDSNSRPLVPQTSALTKLRHSPYACGAPILPREWRQPSPPLTLVGSREYCVAMATCFCGCGREIEGIRRRANNEMSTHMSRDLVVLQGALERGDAGQKTDETRAITDEGVLLLGAIKRYLHGDVERDQLNRRKIKSWAKQARSLAKELLESGTGPAWEPDDHRTNHLAQAGERATGVITDVRRKGWGNDQVASLAMTVLARTGDGTEIQFTRTLSISVVKAPRVGDAVEVAYDPADPTRFVYRPLVEMPGADSSASPTEPSTDRIGKLRELADLREQGLLTQAEFDAEKARLLAE
jgi:hypothetical protein